MHFTNNSGWLLVAMLFLVVSRVLLCGCWVVVGWFLAMQFLGYSKWLLGSW